MAQNASAVQCPSEDAALYLPTPFGGALTQSGPYPPTPQAESTRFTARSSPILSTYANRVPDIRSSISRFFLTNQFLSSLWDGTRISFKVRFQTLRCTTYKLEIHTKWWVEIEHSDKTHVHRTRGQKTKWAGVLRYDNAVRSDVGVSNVTLWHRSCSALVALGALKSFAILESYVFKSTKFYFKE